MCGFRSELGERGREREKVGLWFDGLCWRNLDLQETICACASGSARGLSFRLDFVFDGFVLSCESVEISSAARASLFSWSTWGRRCSTLICTRREDRWIALSNDRKLAYCTQQAGSFVLWAG